MRVLKWVCIAGVVAITAVGCGDTDDDVAASTETTTGGDTTGGDTTGGDTTGGDTTGGEVTGGEVTRMYYDGPESAALGANGNEATCATCHANDDAEGYSGSSMKNIAYLTSYKGGAAPSLLHATNACVTGWMGGTALTEDDAAWKALEAYLQSISDESVTEPNTMMPEVLADEAAYADAYAGGDAANGEAAFGMYCAVCHQSERQVGMAKAWSVAGLMERPAGRIAQKVRTSGPPPSDMTGGDDTTPGPMPFFEPDELSEADLKDIVAYLTAGQAQSPTLFYDGDASAALGAAGNEATCATCHSSDGAVGYAGDTLMNVAYKTSFKGGNAPTLLDATNACVTGWMGGTALTEDDEAWKDLQAFMQSISDETETEPNALTPEVMADEAAYEAAYAGGDASKGEEGFNTYCAVCHAGGLQVGMASALAVSTLGNFTVGRIAQKVRTSGPPPSDMSGGDDTTPGPMPFFEPSDLDAGTLANIIAWLKG